MRVEHNGYTIHYGYLASPNGGAESGYCFTVTASFANH